MTKKVLTVNCGTIITAVIIVENTGNDVNKKDVITASMMMTDNRLIKI